MCRAGRRSLGFDVADSAGLRNAQISVVLSAFY
jgi:hypothetical protein